MKSWKRVTDASSGKPKGFGFCVYDQASSVLRALRILGLEPLQGPDPNTKPAGIELPSSSSDVPSKKLLLKVDAVARKHIEEHRSTFPGGLIGEINDLNARESDTKAKKLMASILKEMTTSEADSFLGSLVDPSNDNEIKKMDHDLHDSSHKVCIFFVAFKYLT